MEPSTIRRRVAASTAAAALACGALVVAATSAQAAVTDDPRATSHDGNVKTCAAAGLPGELVDKSSLEYTGGVPNVDQYLTVTAENGVFVTGFVIKGGPAYNVYEPGVNGLSWAPPWEDLRAPLNRGGNVPTISHWFACGTVDSGGS